jgi:hypothetical protein
MQRHGKRPEKDLTNLSPMEAVEVLKRHVLKAVAEKEDALEEVSALKRAIDEMKVELHSNRNIITHFVNEKIQTEAKLLMNMDFSKQQVHVPNRDEESSRRVLLNLQDQLADAHEIVGAQKETIAELLKENKRLLAQIEEQEKATSDAKCENDELKAKLKNMGGEDVAMLAEFLQENEEIMKIY